MPITLSLTSSWGRHSTDNYNTWKINGAFLLREPCLDPSKRRVLVTLAWIMWLSCELEYYLVLTCVPLKGRVKTFSQRVWTKGQMCMYVISVGSEFCFPWSNVFLETETETDLGKGILNSSFWYPASLKGKAHLLVSSAPSRTLESVSTLQLRRV